MLRTRVMPCLLLNENGGLVKTVRFKRDVYVGDPINAVRIFNQKEVDELVLFDISATTKKRPIQFDLIQQITSECFMPLCYGGGVRTIDDFRRLFQMGVEKVSVSSLLFNHPSVVKEAVSIFGSQSIIATLDVNKSRFFEKYIVCTNSSKVNIKHSLLDAVKHVCDLGVGEIIVNAIHQDGTWKGFDLKLIKLVTDHVSVPVVALGGAGGMKDIELVVKESHASAVGLGSMAVFQSKDMGVLIKFPKILELEKFLG